MINLTKDDEKLKKAADELAKGPVGEDRALIEKSLEGGDMALAGMGLEAIDMSLFPPPRLTLVQYSTKGAETMSGKEIPAGKLWIKATGLIEDALGCAFLKAGVTRARFEEGELDKPPLCVSRNGLTGPEGQSCLECQYSKWSEKPPQCRMSLEFLAQTEKGDLFIARFSGTSFKHAQAFINNVRYSKLPIFAHKVMLVPEKVVGGKGKYFELKIRVTGTRSKGELEVLFEDYQKFGKSFMPAVTAGEVKQNAD